MLHFNGFCLNRTRYKADSGSYAYTELSIKHVRFNKIQHPSINRSCFSNKIFVTLKEFLVTLLRIFTENLKSGKHLPYLMLSLKKIVLQLSVHGLIMFHVITDTFGF